MNSSLSATKITSIGNINPYQSHWYAKCGQLSHHLLNFANECGLKALQAVDFSFYGQNSAVIAFANQVKNLQPEKGCFQLDMEQEKNDIELLEQHRILQKSYLHTIWAVAKNTAFVTLAAPLALPAFPLAVGLRAYVQNHMNDVAVKLHSNPKTWSAIEPISIETFNVAMTPFKIMDWFNGVQGTEKRIKPLAQSVNEKKPDFMCFQEGFDTDTIWKVFTKELTNYSIACSAKRKNAVGLSGGVIFITRYKITDVAYHEYSHLVGVDAMTRKGVLAVKVELSPGNVIAMGVTHMQAGYSTGTPEQKSTWTKEQFEEGKKFLLAFAGSDTKDVFFIGDYNVGRFEAGDQPNLAQVKSEYQGMCDGLLTNFKDLTVPNREQDFANAKEHEKHFDTHDPNNQETGKAKGSVYNTEAPSYHFFKELVFLKAREKLPNIKTSLLKISINKRLKGEILKNPYASWTIDQVIQEQLDSTYRKPMTCDHVSLYNKENNLFSEKNYTYSTIKTTDPWGLPSDHVRVKLELFPKN